MRRPLPPLVRSSRAARIITIVVVVGAAIFILLQLQPGLLVANTTPAGGDMGAHVWGPAHIRDHVLPHFRLTGWANDWYAGFPAYHFYFPLPNLLIVLAGVFLPYGVAFKLVSVSGIVGLPVAAWALARMLRLPFPTPAMFAVATVVFVFDRFHTIWGGNAAATLAGEYSFSLALAFALLFIGVLSRALDTGRGRVLAAILFAATALSHLLPAAFAVGGAVVLLVLRKPDRTRWRIVITAGVLGAALAAFWFLPFLARLPYSNDMGWERTQEYLKNLLPWLRHDDAAPAASTAHLKVLMPLAAVGVAIAFARRRRGAVALAGIAASAAAGFVLVPRGAIWNARLLPFWYLTSYLLAAFAVGELALLAGEAITNVSRRTASERENETADPYLLPYLQPPRPVPNVFALAAPLVALAVIIIVTGRPLGIFSSGRIDLPGGSSVPFLKITSADAGANFAPAWAKWNYSGYERKPAYPEYREIVSAMARVGRDQGCGRAMWEYEPEQNRYGTPMALMLLPYWTKGCITSMEGLFFESSATVPYHFLMQSEMSRTPSRAMRDLPYHDLDIASGVEHLQLMGVRYYLATSPEAQRQAAGIAALHLVGTTSAYPVTYGTAIEQRFWQIYRVADSPLVAPLSHLPAVVRTGAQSKAGWLATAVPWFQDRASWGVPLAANGPSDWPRVATRASVPPSVPVGDVKVTNVVLKDDRISFKVDRVGIPVVVRVSYFPNWKASGANGPWRVTPNFMVVVPTSTSVTLHYGWTGIDIAGWFVTFGGVAVAIYLARKKSLVLPRRGHPSVEPDAVVDPFLPSAVDAGDDSHVLTGAPPRA